MPRTKRWSSKARCPRRSRASSSSRCSRCMHTTVLLHEATDAVFTDPDGTYVDGTYGRGGHSRELLARLSASGRLVAFDKDPQAVQAATAGADRIQDARFA